MLIIYTQHCIVTVIILHSEIHEHFLLAVLSNMTEHQYLQGHGQVLFTTNNYCFPK